MDEQMKDKLDSIINVESIENYMTPVNVDGNYEIRRDTRYPILEASGKEGRFNPEGMDVWYVASSPEVAEAEVGSHSEMARYRLAPQDYNAFDVSALAADNNLTEILTLPQDKGSYEICQYITLRVRQFKPTTSGILFDSAAMHKAGEKGHVLLVMPPAGVKLHEEFYQIIP
jgi:hypothetical protein